MALELLQQVPHLDAIIVPVSGGGLISGISIASKALKPGIVMIAAEPLGEFCSATSSKRSSRSLGNSDLCQAFWQYCSMRCGCARQQQMAMLFLEKVSRLGSYSS